MSEEKEVSETNDNAGEQAAADVAPTTEGPTGEGPGDTEELGRVGVDLDADVAEAPPPSALGNSGLPLFVCHKTVQAFKIVSMELLSGGDIEMFDETRDRFVTVTSEYVDKQKPQIGGYFVQYHDGYRSWSPADAFEDGYTAVPVCDIPEAEEE